MAGAEINNADRIKNYISKNGGSAVDAKEAASALNREFGLRGDNRITAQSVIAHKAVLSRVQNEAVEPEQFDASQKRLANQLLKQGTPAELIKRITAWEKRIEAAGGLQPALDRLIKEATLISALKDSPELAVKLLKAHLG